MPAGHFADDQCPAQRALLALILAFLGMLVGQVIGPQYKALAPVQLDLGYSTACAFIGLFRRTFWQPSAACRARLGTEAPLGA